MSLKLSGLKCNFRAFGAPLAFGATASSIRRELSNATGHVWYGDMDYNFFYVCSMHDAVGRSR